MATGLVQRRHKRTRASILLLRNIEPWISNTVRGLPSIQDPWNPMLAMPLPLRGTTAGIWACFAVPAYPGHDDTIEHTPSIAIRAQCRPGSLRSLHVADVLMSARLTVSSRRCRIRRTSRIANVARSPPACGHRRPMPHDHIDSGSLPA